ncbi:hypothetical protein Agabi119p4_8028 [Agaricus bisporus var. burnettii]|uniref:Uncharacterized protein n=1 Tax=Agaricus bisporus var. burnettii TaxID=192524 RepID=A0A8H7C595_AGABI|nr:hypothetical protein Agabi119p4_8028 [Agaricus bisporus var. burnettii]
MSANFTFEDLYRIDHDGLVVSAGVSVSSLFTGGLVVLGTLCLCLLSEERRRYCKQKVFLQTYVIVIVTLDLGLQLTYLFSPHAIAVFHAHSFEEANEKFYQTLRIPMDLFPMLVFALTDGLFIWRCYILQQFLGFKDNWWHHIFWVIPWCFWAFNLAAGITVLAMDNGNPSKFRLLGALSAATFASNAAINIYATLFICLCLYVHHRAAVASYGVQVASIRYRCIINLLLQFAAITVPISITAAVAIGLARGRTTFALAMIPIAGSSQAFTSVLMIHQVLKARTSDTRIESFKLGPVTNAYAIDLRDDRQKPGNSQVDQAAQAEYV